MAKYQCVHKLLA